MTSQHCLPNSVHKTLRLMVTVFALGLLASTAAAERFKVLYRFTGKDDGANPQASLIRDAQGNLYGTTYQGGAFGFGVVFKLEPDGTEIPLHSFDGVDGLSPDGSLVRDADGNLYGTTIYGGTPEGGACVHGCGTVFKVEANGKTTKMYAFTGQSDGSEPSGNLVLDAEGNLYGTTESGGDLSYDCSYVGCGVVFKVDKTGKETVLHTFNSLTEDGANPFGGVIRDEAGNLYGTTAYGGTNGAGTIFKLDGAGKETVLHNFIYEQEESPEGTLTRDDEGNLYGTTVGGHDYGTLFELDKNGHETDLYIFNYQSVGLRPFAGVVRDAFGNLYGTTALGGNSRRCACGVVFKVDRNGEGTVLYNFTGEESVPDQFTPAGVILDKAGNLYGTSPYGGSSYRCDYACGFVYEITP
jgi:uncharacterized repeat protein (TIGR03803 family)